MEFTTDIEAYEPSLVSAAKYVTGFVEACCRKSASAANSSAEPFNAAISILTKPARATWLTLSGVNGCGKTMLARQAFNYVARHYPYAGGVWIGGHGVLTSRRPQVVWLDEVAFVKRCKEGEWDLAEYLGDDWLVVLDDLGASRDKTGFTGEMLFRLCNARVGKFTLFTTNLSLEQISQRIDPRITSRLIRDGNVFKGISAEDYGIRQRRLSA